MSLQSIAKVTSDRLYLCMSPSGFYRQVAAPRLLDIGPPCLSGKRGGTIDLRPTDCVDVPNMSRLCTEISLRLPGNTVGTIVLPIATVSVIGLASLHFHGMNVPPELCDCREAACSECI